MPKDTSTQLLEIEYSRSKGGQPPAPSASLRTRVSLTVPKDASLADTWETTFEWLKGKIDAGLADVEDSLTSQPEQAYGGMNPTPNGAQANALPQPSSLVAIPGNQAQFTGCKVIFEPSFRTDRRNKPFVQIRLGNSDQIPGYGEDQEPGYIYAKSYDSDIIQIIKDTIRESDIVDVTGYYDTPWTHRSGAKEGQVQLDFILQGIQRS